MNTEHMQEIQAACQSLKFLSLLYCSILKAFKMRFYIIINPNLTTSFTGLVGKVRKKLSPEGGRKGGWRKKTRAARPPGLGLEPGTCRVLGEGHQLHAMGAV